MSKVIVISLEKLTKIWFLGIVGLAIASFSITVFSLLTSRGSIFGLVRLFDIAQENNIPTWYQSIALFLCSIVLGLIAHSKRISDRRWFPYWRTLAIIFLFLSLDEVASVHELLVAPTQKVLHPSDFLFYGWVIPAATVVAILFANYWKFLQHLPQPTKRLIILAGALYVGGAVGCEMIGGYIDSHIGIQNLPYIVEVTCEETLEMVGALVFLYALLTYFSTQVKEVTVQIVNQLQAEKALTEDPSSRK